MVPQKKYSSFGQLKGLLWRDWFDHILAKDFREPVGAVIDLTDACNLNCYWCNARSFRSGNMLETKHVFKCIDMLSEWGCGSICYAGGGEPSLHRDFAKIIDYTYDTGVEIGISTNGVLLTDEMIKSIAHKARFCGFSIDAGTESVWTQLKGPNKWNALVSNAKKLAKESEDALDFTFKFILVPENQNEILGACCLAKRLGFNNFFVRPAAFERVRGLEDIQAEFDRELIDEQLGRCLELETKDFKVYKSFDRVTRCLKRELKFDKCRATPLIAVLCADGYCYLCIDRREDAKVRLCKHLELGDFWNSERHHEMIENINLEECPRCAFSHYNQQIEAYKGDYMYVRFP